MKWDVAFTLRFAELVAPFRLDWIEEPLPPDDLAGYAQLALRTPIPIAGGEHEFTAAAFAELIQRRLHQVVQPDVCWCGGMTELVKIYRSPGNTACASVPIVAAKYGPSTPWPPSTPSPWPSLAGRG